jgi:hypothetical protein
MRLSLKITMLALLHITLFSTYTLEPLIYELPITPQPLNGDLPIHNETQTPGHTIRYSKMVLPPVQIPDQPTPIPSHPT